MKIPSLLQILLYFWGTWKCFAPPKHEIQKCFTHMFRTLHLVKKIVNVLHSPPPHIKKQTLFPTLFTEMCFISFSYPLIFDISCFSMPRQTSYPNAGRGMFLGVTYLLRCITTISAWEVSPRVYLIKIRYSPTCI